jgi:cellulose synthase/poly-beta-1,6-N-acetylglucosamine synthase-like glycosyltransferase
VADDGSTDRTGNLMLAYSRSHPTIRYLRTPHGGVNSARNSGIKQSIGQIICLVDDDEIVPTDWLSMATRLLDSHPDVGGVGGPYVSWGVPPFRTCPRCRRLGDLAPPAGQSWLLGGNMALRRPVLDQVGLFDESLNGLGDDSEWLYRAARHDVRFLFDQELFVWHRRDTQHLPSLIGKGLRQGRQHPKAFHSINETTSSKSAYQATCYLFRSIGHSMLKGCCGGLIGAAEAVGRLIGAFDIVISDRKK